MIKTWNQSNDPDYEIKTNTVLEKHEITDGNTRPGPTDPTEVLCKDELSR